MIYHCWDALNCEEGDARKIESSSPGWAAERYAEHRNQQCAEYPSESVVRVRTPEGELLEFTVSLHAEPVYTAGIGKCIESVASEDRR